MDPLQYEEEYLVNAKGIDEKTAKELTKTQTAKDDIKKQAKASNYEEGAALLSPEGDHALSPNHPNHSVKVENTGLKAENNFTGHSHSNSYTKAEAPDVAVKTNIFGSESSETVGDTTTGRKVTGTAGGHGKWAGKDSTFGINAGVKAENTKKRQISDNQEFADTTGYGGEMGVERDKDGNYSASGKGSVKKGYKLSETNTLDNGTTRTDTKGIEGETSLGYKAGKTTVGQSVKDVEDIGNGRTKTSTVTDKAGVNGNVGFKDGDRSYGAGAKVGRTWNDDISYTEGTDKVVEKTNRGVNANTNWTDEGGMGYGLGYSTGSSKVRTLEDGTTIETDKIMNTAKSDIKKDKQGLDFGRTKTNKMTKEQLTEKTTRTQLEGTTTYGAGATRSVDDEGNATYGVEGKAGYTHYQDRYRHKFGNMGPLGDVVGDAGYRVGAVDGKVGASFKKGKDGVTLTGNVGGTVTVVDGTAKITATPFTWRMAGEDMEVQLYASVNAGLVAEANGNIDLTVGKGSESFDVAIGGGGKAFAGLKAGAEVGAKVRWKRQSAGYGDDLKRFAKNLPGNVDDWFIDKVNDDVWPQIANGVFGSRASDIMAASAGVKGTAGLGAEASLTGGWKNGKIDISASLGGTIGLGGGVATKTMLDAFNGVRFLALLGVKGYNWISDKVRQASNWMGEITKQVRKEIDKYMERKKEEGGISGGLAKAADFVGSKVFKLW
jgi:hypothetical protein